MNGVLRRSPLLATLAALALHEGAPAAAALFCSARSYAATDGTSCAACPANTARLLDNADTAAGPGSTVGECVCEPGFYSPIGGAAGTACVPCPSGGVCDGRGAPPRAVRGFWRLTTEVLGLLLLLLLLLLVLVLLVVLLLLILLLNAFATRPSRAASASSFDSRGASWLLLQRLIACRAGR